MMNNKSLNYYAMANKNPGILAKIARANMVTQMKKMLRSMTTMNIQACAPPMM